MSKSEELQQEYDDLLDEQQKVQQLLFDADKQFAETEQQLIQMKQQYGETLVDYKIGKGTKKETDLIKRKVTELASQLDGLDALLSFGSHRIKVLDNAIINTQRTLGNAIESERLRKLKAELIIMQNDGMSAVAIVRERNIKVSFVEKILGIGQANYGFGQP